MDKRFQGSKKRGKRMAMAARRARQAAAKEAKEAKRKDLEATMDVFIKRMREG